MKDSLEHCNDDCHLLLGLSLVVREALTHSSERLLVEESVEQSEAHSIADQPSKHNFLGIGEVEERGGADDELTEGRQVPSQQEPGPSILLGREESVEEADQTSREQLSEEVHSDLGLVEVEIHLEFARQD